MKPPLPHLLRPAARLLRLKLVTLLVLPLVLLMLILNGMPRAFADTPPQLMVRAHLEPAGPVVAGTQVKLVVDLLTTTWFVEAPNWPLFTLPDAVVSLPDEQATNLSEEINGVRWFGVSRAYRIAPQAGKTYAIAPFTITVYPGGTTSPSQVSTPALSLVATVPPGAAGMKPFFPAPQLSATQTITPAPKHLRVGDTLTRTITQRATGIESMLIPPLTFGEIDGLKRYPNTAVTRNLVQDRAGLVAGERSDSVTYRAERSGHFKLPPMTIEWWNTTTQRKASIVLPAVTFTAEAVHEKLLFEIPTDAIGLGMPHRIIVLHGHLLLIGGALLLCIATLIWTRERIVAMFQRMQRRVKSARKRYREGHFAAWLNLRRAARAGSWQHMIPALYRWMDQRQTFGQPALLANLARSGDPSASALATEALTHYAPLASSRQPDGKALQRTLWRISQRTRQRSRAESALPPLNER
ncbi:hypothetical protein [Paraburkholderia bonniea]|uniref:hypothetical protein n=1 Tax=Paraburkholderia bonniea TaxID=2152891 RepID=UPI001FE6E4CD|nr:hypothetical protein [Paraburkholderia bonniea]